MNDSVSVTSSSLAVSEKTPRRNGGCVGVLFQLFDWNRRFTKKKFFSKRLLLSDRAKEGSKKFGGDDKLPKLRLIADENSGGFPNKNKTGVNEVQTPNLVARLMGLESMPSGHRDNLQKDNSDELTDTRREKVVSGNGEFRPQKLQKTGMVDRRSVSRFGAEALQLKHILSQSRKHHHPKLVSPVKSTGHHPKRNSSRLIDAATRILEPGLRARNTSKYAISYGQGASKPLQNGLRSEPVGQGASRPLRNGLGSEPVGQGASRPLRNGLRSEPVGQGASRPLRNGLGSEPVGQGASRPLRNGLRSEPVKGEDLDFVSGHTSCRNCGNLIDIAESTSKRDVQTSVFGSVNNSRYDQEHEFSTDVFIDQLKFNCLSGQTLSRVLAKGEDMKFDKRGKFGSARVNSSSPRQKRQVTHTRREGVVSSSINRFVWQQDCQGQIGNMNNDDGMAFRFNSPMKNNPNAPVCKPTSRKRFTSNRSDEKIRAQKPFPLTVAGYESGIYGNPPNFCLQPIRSEKVLGLIGGKSIDHLSPGSVLEASFSNDSCCSSSLEDSSVRTQHADSMSYSCDDESHFQESETDPFDSGGPLRKENTHNKLVANLLTYITQVLCSMDLVNSRTKGNIKEVIFNSELVLSNQMTHNPNEVNSFFICDLLLELDTLADAMWGRFDNFLGPQNSNAGYRQKLFVFDSLIEYLESKYVQYSKCGFRAWMNLPRFMGFDHLVCEVVEEVRRWMGARFGEPHVEIDTSHGSGKWADFEIEAYETGAKVEWDIVEMLIDELVVDVSTRIGGFRV